MSVSDSQQEFLVTARKWRPQRFGDVVGQDHISTTLSNAIKSGRTHHAYLFCGPRGVGKTTNARIFARALNCLQPQGTEPCNECAACVDMLNARSMDVIEIDGASNNSVDDIRKLRENAKYPPVNGKYKVYIIDEVHMLSTSAFNALLKTLEEPPPHLMFIFATTESHKVPATIVSRCQRFDFRRMEIDTIVKQLQFIASREGISIDEDSLIAIAKKGDGSMRDSQSIFDQVRAFCGDTIQYSDVANALHLIDEEFYFTISTAIRTKDVAAMFGIVKSVMDKGYDVHECLVGLLEHFRNFLTILATGNTSLIETSSAMLQRYTVEAVHFSKQDVLRIMTLINNTENTLKYAPQPRLKFELLLSQLASLDSTVEISALLKEIADLKKNSSASLKEVSSPKASVHAVAPTYSAPQTAPSTVQKVAQPTVEYTSATQATAAQSAPTTTSTVQPAQYNDAVANVGAVQKIAVREPEATVSAPQSSSLGGVSSEELRVRWNAFLQSLPVSQAATKMTFGLANAATPTFYDDEIFVVCTEKFICDDLQSRRAALAKHLEQFYKYPVKISFALSGAERTSSPEAPAPLPRIIPAPHREVAVVAGTQTATNGESVLEEVMEVETATIAAPLDARSAIEELLVTEFRAKKIPLSKR